MTKILFTKTFALDLFSLVPDQLSDGMLPPIGELTEGVDDVPKELGPQFVATGDEMEVEILEDEDETVTVKLASGQFAVLDKDSFWSLFGSFVAL